MQKFLLLIFLTFIPIGVIGKASVRESAPVKDKSKSDSQIPKVDYGHIFMEETKQSKSGPISFSVFGGQEINPYISAPFLGLEFKYRTYTHLHLGFEYITFFTKLNSTLKALEKNVNSYGLNLHYPLLDSGGYINLHYSLFRGHANLLGFLRMDMDLPMQVGGGFINMKEGGSFPSVKWGMGPRILFNSLAIQLVLSQFVGGGSIQQLYSWYAVNLIYNL